MMKFIEKILCSKLAFKFTENFLRREITIKHDDAMGIPEEIKAMRFTDKPTLSEITLDHKGTKSELKKKLEKAGLLRNGRLNDNK